MVLILFIIFLGISPQINYAQKKLSETEQLNFQSAFFEALKQKAIGNYGKAIAPLEFCYNLDSTNVAVLFELSKNYYWQKKYFEAQQSINKALKLQANNIWLLEQAKKIAFAQQNYEGAILFQKKIIAINPSKKISLVNLYLAANKKNKAITLLNNIEKEQGLTDALKKTRKQLLKSKKPKVVTKVSTNLNELKKIYDKTNNFEVLKKILALEAAQKKYLQLNTDAVAGLEIFPSQAVLYLYAAIANNGLKKFKKAINFLDNGIDFVIDTKTQKNYYLAYANSYIGLKNNLKANAFKKRASQL